MLCKLRRKRNARTLHVHDEVAANTRHNNDLLAGNKAQILKVTMDVTRAIEDIKAGKVEYRVDKTAIVHCPIGKKSFDPEKLKENLQVLMEAINKAKPSAAKGIYLKSVVLSSTMGPGVKVNPLKF